MSVFLKGTSSKGPIQFKIPVEKIAEPGETIHQLAARKAVGELEEGRGWLSFAKDEHGTLLKDKFGNDPSFVQFGGKPKPSRFDEIVEREAVRLGVEYQVGSKFWYVVERFLFALLHVHLLGILDPKTRRGSSLLQRLHDSGNTILTPNMWTAPSSPWKAMRSRHSLGAFVANRNGLHQANP